MLVNLERVSKRVADGTQVLRQVSLTLAAGEVLLLHGRSGSGKSTLLNIIAANILPDEGKATVCGYDLTQTAWNSLPAFRRRVVYLHAQNCLFPNLSLLDNCLIAVDMARIKVADPIRHVAQALRQAEFNDVNQLCTTLSYEARVRATLVRASIVQPQVLLCDELLQPLQPEDMETITEQIARLSQQGTAVILSNNNPLPQHLKIDYTLTLDSEDTAREAETA